MNSYERIHEALTECAQKRGLASPFSLEEQEDISFGDYATNLAFMIAKKEGKNPKDIAEELKGELMEKVADDVERIDVAGAGFINFFLKDDVRTDEAELIAQTTQTFADDADRQGKVIVEYTDPNPFKLFHIGHLVPNAIGESVARLYESQGYDVTRACYQGDVGMHVATTLWGLQHFGEAVPDEGESLREKVAYLGRAYAYGTQVLADNEHIKNEIVDINKAVFTRSNDDINFLYDEGRAWSLDYFETLYTKLGTKFDHYIFESEVAESGAQIVNDNLGAVFEKSDGAIVFKGEDDGLHTRVFINSQGLPTYEAKELGVTHKKAELVPDAVQSIVVTAKEIDEYFKVMKTVLEKINKPLADTLLHISHGMLRLPEGKMSSRKGNIIPAEELIDMVSERLKDRLEEMKVEGHKRAELVNDIAVGAIKFSILKSAPGKDIIFDFEKSLSFEGDSGPYLQYTHARICALLDKAREVGIETDAYVVEKSEKELERAIAQYERVLAKAFDVLGPHHIVQYLLLLTRAFNSVYGRQQFVDATNKERSAYYVMLAMATKNILSHGLHTLGIKAPERM